MKDNMNRISVYIDQLNKEEKPKEHDNGYSSNEMDDMAETVRRLRSLREPAFPEDDFKMRLIASLRSDQYTKASDDMHSDLQRSKHFKHKHKYIWFKRAVLFTAATAAAVLLFSYPNITSGRKETNIVYAMEQAMQKVKAYHGIVEVVVKNGLGETTLQSRREVWADEDGRYYVKELEGYSKGFITVNDTTREWQIRPEEKKLYVFDAFPDPYRFTFELDNEVKDVKNAVTVKKLKEENISGRETVVLEVIPDGGAAYQLWVDKKTELPLKKQSAMQNALQITIAYTEISFSDEIPDELLVYQIPEGYDVVMQNTEQPVSTIDEAADLLDFNPILPKKVPYNYHLKGIAVMLETNTAKLYYSEEASNKTAVVLQRMIKEKFAPDSQAILGKVANNPAEILHNYQDATDVKSIRWQENGMEYTVFGNASLEELSVLVEGFSSGEVYIPDSSGNDVKRVPQIEVPIDLTVEENEQKSVDAGHSPWRLDPVFVAHVFSNILISPEGIVGDYPILYEDMVLIENNGVEAVIEVENEKSIARYVYLKKIVRQDETGIWTVVGYDPRE